MACNCSRTIFFKDSQNFQSFFLDPNRYLRWSNDQGSASNYGLLPLCIKKVACGKNQARMNFVVHNNVQRPADDEAPIPSAKSSNSWKGWILGVLVSIFLPFQRQKLNPFFAIKNEVAMVVESAEFVVDVVEKVAEEVVEITDDLVDKLPEGGKLKGAINIVENLAKEIDKDAHLVGQLIDKVEEVEKEVESFIEHEVKEGTKSKTR
ncbi:hypothetical protein LguiA_013687 [Lonicera macranthoides]